MGDERGGRVYLCGMGGISGGLSANIESWLKVCWRSNSQASFLMR